MKWAAKRTLCTFFIFVVGPIGSLQKGSPHFATAALPSKASILFAERAVVSDFDCHRSPCTIRYHLFVPVPVVTLTNGGWLQLIVCWILSHLRTCCILLFFLVVSSFISGIGHNIPYQSVQYLLHQLAFGDRTVEYMAMECFHSQ